MMVKVLSGLIVSPGANALTRRGLAWLLSSCGVAHGVPQAEGAVGVGV